MIELWNSPYWFGMLWGILATVNLLFWMIINLLKD
jgi:hypothetical protein